MVLLLQGTEAMVPEEVGARAAHSLLEEISRGGVCDSTHQVSAWRCSTPDTACLLSGSCSWVHCSAPKAFDGRCSTARHSRPLGALLLLPSVSEYCCHKPCLSSLPSPCCMSIQAGVLTCRCLVHCRAYCCLCVRLGQGK